MTISLVSGIDLQLKQVWNYEDSYEWMLELSNSYWLRYSTKVSASGVFSNSLGLRTIEYKRCIYHEVIIAV